MKMIRNMPLMVLVLLPLLAAAAEIPVKSGEKIAFLGDSITQMGMGTNGYCTLVVAGLKANGIEVTPIAAGRSGSTSAVLGGVAAPALKQKPDWMTVNGGINDIAYAADRGGVPLEQYKINMTKIVDKIQAAGVKVMILTITPIGEDLDTPKNQTMTEYNAFLRTLAEEKHCLLADLNVDFQKNLKEKKEQNRQRPKPAPVTLINGLHPFGEGQRVMARGVLRAFGLTDAQMARVEEAWKSLPGVEKTAPRSAK